MGWALKVGFESCEWREAVLCEFYSFMGGFSSNLDQLASYNYQEVRIMTTY